jgi:hypothetical protein
MAQSRQKTDAIIKAPDGPSVAEDFEDAVTEDNETCSRSHSAGLSWEILTAKHSHHHSRGRQKQRI